MRGRAPLAAGVLTLAACGIGPGPPTATVVDSAGIAVVTSRARPAADPLYRATVELEYGAVGADAAAELGHVADAAVGEDGRIFVLDQLARTVRVFDADGAPAGALGGPGDGPGELSRFAASLLRRGDTLLVGDWGHARMHRFLTGGSFLDALPLPAPPAARSWWRAAPDGTAWFRVLTRTVVDGRWSGDDLLYRVAGAWASPDSVFRFRYAEADLGGPGRARLPLMVNAPFWTALPDGGFAWGTLQSIEVRIHSPDGRLRAIARHEGWVRRPPGEADRAALRTLMGDKLVMLGGSRRAVEQLEVEDPDLLPAITAVRAGPGGTLWVQRFGGTALAHPTALNTPDPPESWGGGTWDVLDDTGASLGRVDLPDRVRILEIAGDHVWAVRWDELLVERVVRLRLESGAGGAAARADADADGSL